MAKGIVAQGIVAKGIVAVAGAALLCGAGAVVVELTDPAPQAAMTVLADQQVEAQTLNIIW